MPFRSDVSVMMLSVSMYGLVFATLTSPILESVNALEYVSLFSIFAGLGLSIMTPIGGKLGDLIGRRNIVVIPGIICAVCGIIFAFVHSLVPLMALRLIIGIAQGAFTAGWTKPAILVGFLVGIVGLVALVKIENKSEEPIIPMRLFSNKLYAMLLLVGFICYFYQNAMNIYAPIGALRVMGVSTTVAGSLQMPRTIITIFLPTIAGAWVGKKSGNSWKAMAIGTALVAIPMAVMGFTNANTSIMVYFVALAITGIAESFRSVSITPAAQATLMPQDMGVGTSLVNFVNSLAGTIAVAVCGAAYNVNTASDPANVANIQGGVRAVFWLVTVVSVIGLLLVIFVVRPQMSKKEAAE